MAVKTNQVKNIISATDKTNKAFRAAGSSAKKYEITAKGVAKSVGRSFSVMGKAMGIGLAAIGGAGLAIFEFSRRTAAAEDSAGKFAGRIGIAVDELTRLQHAADLTGVSTEKLEMGLQRMTRRVAEAAKGTGEARGALKELGIDALELNKLDPGAQFTEITRAMEGVELQSDKVRLAMKLFDSEGVALLQTMQDGAAGLEAMKQSADDLGITISEEAAANAADFNDTLTELQGLVGGLAREMADDLIPLITDIAQDITNWIKANEDIIRQDLAAWIDGVGVAAENLGFLIGGLANEFTLKDRAKAATTELLKMGTTAEEITGLMFKDANKDSRAFQESLIRINSDLKRTGTINAASRGAFFQEKIIELLEKKRQLAEIEELKAAGRLASLEKERRIREGISLIDDEEEQVADAGGLDENAQIRIDRVRAELIAREELYLQYDAEREEREAATQQRIMDMEENAFQFKLTNARNNIAVAQGVADALGAIESLSGKRSKAAFILERSIAAASAFVNYQAAAAAADKIAPWSGTFFRALSYTVPPLILAQGFAGKPSAGGATGGAGGGDAGGAGLVPTAPAQDTVAPGAEAIPSQNVTIIIDNFFGGDDELDALAERLAPSMDKLANRNGTKFGFVTTGET